MNAEVIADKLLWVVGAVLAVIAAAWRVRRGISKDVLETQKNQGEGGWITQMQRERDSALERERATWDLHLKDAEAIASLTMKNVFLVEKLERMDKQIQLIKRLLLDERPELAKLLDTDFGDLSSR